MKLNEKMIGSLKVGLEAHYKGEVPDEVLESIGGGRLFTENECQRLYDVNEEYLETHGFVVTAEDMPFFHAVSKYIDYIEALPEDGPEKLFVLEEWL